MNPTEVRAAVYLRISRDPNDTRKGVARQRKDCTELAAELDWPVVEIFDENNVSATRAKARPEYQRLLRAIESGAINAVVFWEFDRFTRSPREADDMLDLAKRLGLRAASTSGGEMDLTSPTGRRNVVVAGADARKETDQLSKRLKRAFDQKAAEGEPHGAVPYGWRRVRDYDQRGNLTGSRDELRESEAETIRTASRMLLAGRSLRSVTAELNAAGSVSPRARVPWSSATLRQVLLRDRNAGLRRHRGQVIGAGKWPAIYDRDTHDRIKALLTDPGRRTNKGTVPRHLLTGIARCGKCGSKDVVVNIGRVTNTGKRQPPAYICRACTRVRRKQSAVDDLVTAVVIRRLSQPDALAALAQGNPTEVEHHRAEAEALKARLDLASDEYADGAIDAAQLRRITERLRPKIEKAKAAVQAALPTPGLAELVGPDAAARWAEAPLDVKRAVIETLCVVTIMPTGPGKPFDPERVRFGWRTG